MRATDRPKDLEACKAQCRSQTWMSTTGSVTADGSSVNACIHDCDQKFSFVQVKAIEPTAQEQNKACKDTCREHSWMSTSGTVSEGTSVGVCVHKCDMQFPVLVQVSQPSEVLVCEAACKRSASLSTTGGVADGIPLSECIRKCQNNPN